MPTLSYEADQPGHSPRNPDLNQPVQGFPVLFEEASVCVLIPTYNNAATLGEILEAVSQYVSTVVVINDGSTDATASVISRFPRVHPIQYQPNRGKGWALRQGIAAAQDMGFRYAITLDSDGQHFAKDLPGFLQALASHPRAILLGARDMTQAGIPQKSSFGHRFSNFWFRVETGVAAPDTQTGYRLYPIEAMKGMRFFTRKYEFEIEVLVRCSWRGIGIESLPISVYYPPPGQRVSHFRPFWDFARISVLNTVLFTIAIFYIKPRNLLLRLFQKKNWAQLWGSGMSAERNAASVGLGVLMGILPIWGFQLIAAIFLAVLLRLNKALVILAANISLPPMIPLLIYFSFRIGAWWMPAQATQIDYHPSLTVSSIRVNLQQYLYGSITLACLAGAGSFILAWLFLKWKESKGRVSPQANPNG